MFRLAEDWFEKFIVEIAASVMAVDHGSLG
jgi:hypothetical protein